jgi:hypothetical protein
MVRRTIRCRLDANMEDPERRTFRGNPLAAIQRNRGAYVAAGLIIARAYICAGKPERLKPLASYVMINLFEQAGESAVVAGEAGGAHPHADICPIAPCR